MKKEKTFAINEETPGWRILEIAEEIADYARDINPKQESFLVAIIDIFAFDFYATKHLKKLLEKIINDLLSAPIYNNFHITIEKHHYEGNTKLHEEKEKIVFRSHFIRMRLNAPSA